MHLARFNYLKAKERGEGSRRNKSPMDFVARELSQSRAHVHTNTCTRFGITVCATGARNQYFVQLENFRAKE